MIDPAIEHRIRELLASGRHSQREIARMTGASRPTVDAMASGKRGDLSAAHEARIARREHAPFSGIPTRCPTCGRLVQMPCLACWLAAENAAGHLQRPQGLADDGGFQLDLSPEHQARYRWVRGLRIFIEKE